MRLRTSSDTKLSCRMPRQTYILPALHPCMSLKSDGVDAESWAAAHPNLHTR